MPGIEDDDDELLDPSRRLTAQQPAAVIPKASSGDSGIPPVTLRGISPQLQQRTTEDETQAQNLSKGSGISQVQNPIGRRVLRGLNIAGSIASGIAPIVGGVMRQIPGTEEHHNELLGQNRSRLSQDIAEQGKEAETAQTIGQTSAIPSSIAHTQAETNALNNPQPKDKEEKWSEFTGWTDTDGTPLIREENSGQVVRASDKKPATGFKAATPAKPLQTRDVTRVVGGVPHTVMVNAETGADIKDEGQTKVAGETPEQKRSASESAQVERESRVNIRKAQDLYEGTKSSVGQLNASIDAAKDGNGLLTSFVPTMEVLGINAAQGVHRISPAEAQAAQLPGGFVERFNAYFDKASTGKLSPELQAEGKQLGGILLKSAYSRYKSTYDNENSIVSGYGGTGFDKRVPLIQEEQGGQPQYKEGDTATGPKGEKIKFTNGNWVPQ